MPKYYCEYCGIYLANSSPTTRKEHNNGRKHVQNRIDYFSQLLIEAHQEGTLSKINDVFARAEAAEKNSKQPSDVLRNPFSNPAGPTGSAPNSAAPQDWSSWTIPGLAQTTIGVVPVPGMNLALNLGNAEGIDKKMDWMRSYIPYKLVQVPNGENQPNPQQ